MSPHAKSIGKAIKAAGVVWHDCDGCGNPWPFPMGVPPESSIETHEHREWLCHRCVSSLVAGQQRLHARLVACLRREAQVLAEQMLDEHEYCGKCPHCLFVTEAQGLLRELGDSI